MPRHRLGRGQAAGLMGSGETRKGIPGEGCRSVGILGSKGRFQVSQQRLGQGAMLGLARNTELSVCSELPAVPSWGGAELAPVVWFSLHSPE